MRKLLLILIAVAIPLSSMAKVVDYIVAVVNDEPILYSELVDYAKMMRIQDLRAARDSLIEKKILLTVAKGKGIDATDSEVERAVDNFAKANGFKSREDFLKAIEREGISLEDVKRKLKEQIIISKLISRDVKSKVEVSDVDVEKACDEAMSEPLRSVYYIFIKKGNEQKLKRAMEALKEGIPFPDVAKRYSDDRETGKKGGYLGNVKRGSLIKPLDIAVWSARPGKPEKVEVKDGYYIVLVEKEFVEGCDRNRIREKLYMERFKKALKDYIDNLKRTASVKVYF